MTVSEGIRSQEFSAKQLTDKLDGYLADFKSEKQKVEKMAADTDALKARATFQTYRTNDMEDKIELIERELRRNRNRRGP